jgi:dTDP-4-dehydrorhamnose reductase
VTPNQARKALITGANGQLGRELQATVPKNWEMIAYASQSLDVTNPEMVRRVMRQVRPTVLINTAAYTAVDDAEREASRAHAVNAEGARNVAEAAHQVGARVIHISTDYVFDGLQSRPYAPSDEARPLGVYGRTKLIGEELVQESTGGAALIVRTAWLYAGRGRNFVTTMLRRMRTGESVSIVYDQVGTPTWARELAQACWRAAENPGTRGLMHWTDAGVASWYDFAVAVQEEALAAGLLTHAAPVYPIRTDQFPRPARRPSYSVLDKTTGWTALGGPAAHWRVNLRCMLQEVARG